MTDLNLEDSDFVFADGVTAKQLHREFSRPKKALSEAERNSLVKGSKSPTPQCLYPSGKEDLSIYEPIKEIDDLIPVFEADTKGPGRFTMIQRREWSDEFRIRTRVETSLLKPPVNDGPRESTMLSSRGARKITDSCYFMAKCHGGYKTFVTGTFIPEIREKIKSNETSVQREVTRTMDGLQKMYQRGWTTQDGNRIEGIDVPLAYCWVVEIPMNEKGEQNPHVHMMLNWEVPQNIFGEWAARIEAIWGNGYFHLEKIHDPLCAGAYMAKAANYMTKSANESDQGKVRGNRYGISKTARAPEWLTVTESELGIMGRLISEMNDRQKEKTDHLYLQRNQLRKALINCPKSKTHNRQTIGKKLQQVREEIRSLPIVTTGYQLIFKTSDTFWHFMGWAVGAGWNAAKRPSSRWLEEFDRRRLLEKQNRAIRSMQWTDFEWTNALKDYRQYENVAIVEFPLTDWEQYENSTTC